MKFHRMEGNPQSAGDCLVGGAVRHRGEHFQFARRQSGGLDQGRHIALYFSTAGNLLERGCIDQNGIELDLFDQRDEIGWFIDVCGDGDPGIFSQDLFESLTQRRIGAANCDSKRRIASPFQSSAPRWRLLRRPVAHR